MWGVGGVRARVVLPLMTWIHVAAPAGDIEELMNDFVGSMLNVHGGWVVCEKEEARSIAGIAAGGAISFARAGCVMGRHTIPSILRM